MPKGPILPKQIVADVEALWVQHPELSASGIWRLTTGFHPRPSERKTQQIVKAVKGWATSMPQDPTLIPWGEGWPDGADDISCLFGLLQVVKLLGAFGLAVEPLDTRTAKWALRLRRFFDAADPGERNSSFNHLRWARDYARRERVQEVLGHDHMRTEDLDGLFMMRGLDSDEHWESYIAAVEGGLVPPLDAPTSIQDRITLDPMLPDFFIQFVLEKASEFRTLEAAGGVTEEDQTNFEWFQENALRVLRHPGMKDALNQLAAKIQQGESDGSDQE